MRSFFAEIYVNYQYKILKNITFDVIRFIIAILYKIVKRERFF